MNLTAKTDSATENEAKPKRRRKLWLIISFLILAILVVFAVAVFAKPSASNFGFLHVTKLIVDTEDIIPNFNRTESWVRLGLYQSEKPYEEMTKKVRDELIPLGWREDKVDDATTVFKNQSLDTEISVGANLNFTSISINQSHPPTASDYLRIWLNSRLPFLSRKHAAEGM